MLKGVLKLAAKDDISAIKNIAGMLQSGTILKKSSEAAIDWYMKAHELGDESALLLIKNIRIMNELNASIRYMNRFKK